MPTVMQVGPYSMLQCVLLLQLRLATYVLQEEHRALQFIVLSSPMH